MATRNGNGYKLGVEHRITKLEEAVCGISESIEELKTNHIAHLAASIQEIKDGQKWFIRFMLGTAIGAVGYILKTITEVVLKYYNL